MHINLIFSQFMLSWYRLLTKKILILVVLWDKQAGDVVLVTFPITDVSVMVQVNFIIFMTLSFVMW